MSLRGKIAVDVQFANSTSAPGVSSVKTVALQEATEYTTGKAAIISGTVGTGQVSINVAPTDYRDASGTLVSFATVERFAFSASAASICQGFGEDELLRSDGGRVSVTDASNPVGFSIAKLTAGTAAYTLVIYGT